MSGSPPERLGLLRRADALHALSRDLLGEIAGDLIEQRVPAGAALFDEGEPGGAAYFVASGRIALQAGGITVLVREPGDCVGEFALIDDGPRSATARALSDAVVLRWDRADFCRSLARSPQVANAVFRMLTRKLREDVDAKVRDELGRARWRQDLARAREIQMGMLPACDLDLPGLEVAGVSRPAAEVGGDFYDWLPLPPTCCGLLIADVTGHGFYSGLLVAMTKSSLHAGVQSGAAPARMVAALRGTLELALDRQLMMSCCYVLFEPQCRRLSFANAGHPPPCVWRAADASIEWLEPIDPLLGALEIECSTYRCERRPWARGDMLIAYTDGVTELRDAHGGQFGQARLEACVRAHARQGPRALLGALLTAIEDHGQGRDQDDDMTLVVARAT